MATAPNDECPWHERGDNPEKVCDRCVELLKDQGVNEGNMKRDLKTRLAACTGAHDNRPFLGCRTCGDKNGTGLCGACGHFFGPEGGWTRDGDNFKHPEEKRCNSVRQFLLQTTEQVPADRNGPPPSQGNDDDGTGGGDGGRGARNDADRAGGGGGGRGGGAGGGGGGANDEDAAEAKRCAERIGELMKELDGILTAVCVEGDGDRWEKLMETFQKYCDPNNSNFIKDEGAYYRAANEAMQKEYSADKERYKEGEKRIADILDELKSGRDRRFEAARRNAHKMILLRLAYKRGIDIDAENQGFSDQLDKLVKAQARLDSARASLAPFEGPLWENVPVSLMTGPIKARISVEEENVRKIRDEIKAAEARMEESRERDYKKRKPQLGVSKDNLQTPPRAREEYKRLKIAEPMQLDMGEKADDEENTTDG